MGFLATSKARSARSLASRGECAEIQSSTPASAPGAISVPASISNLAKDVSASFLGKYGASLSW